MLLYLEFLLRFGQVQTRLNGFFIFTPTSNPELDIGSGPYCHPDPWPDLGPVRPGSGSNQSSGPDYSSTTPNYQRSIVGSVQAWPATTLIRHVCFWGAKFICMYFIIFCRSFLSPKLVRNILSIWCHRWIIPPVFMFHLILPPIFRIVFRYCKIRDHTLSLPTSSKSR